MELSKEKNKNKKTTKVHTLFGQSQGHEDAILTKGQANFFIFMIEKEQANKNKKKRRRKKIATSCEDREERECKDWGGQLNCN